MASTLQEYLVSLGAEVDEKGIAKIHGALSTTKKAALGVTTALAAVVTMIAKTSVSLDETSRKYEQMARAQKKSTEEIRAQETALKVMGKTLKEVQADKVLNAQYEALLKVGKGLALPEASGGTLVLRDIIGTIEELRLKGTYALQWINHHLLNKLYYPLSRLRNGLQNFSMKLSANFPSWTEKIATGLSYIVRLFGAGVEGVADLVGWIAKLPPEIKLVGEAIGIAFGVSKLGPVGMTIAAITGLLLLLEDFYTWKNGTGPSRLGDFWQSISDGTLLSPEGVQAFLGRLDEVFGNVTEKVGQFLDIGTDITGKITEGISSFDAEAAGETLAGVVSKIILGIENVINGNDTRFYDFAQSSLTMVTTLLGKVMTTLGTFLGSAEWGQMLEGALTMGTNFINNVFDLVLGKEGADGTEAEQGLARTLVGMLQNVVTGLGDGLKKISFDGLGDKVGTFITGLFEKIGGFFKREGTADAPITKLLGSGIDVVKSALSGVMDFLLSMLSSVNFSEVGGSINSVIMTVLGWIGQALQGAADLILGNEAEDGLASKILDFIRGALTGLGELIGQLDFSAIGAEIGTFVSGLFSQIGTFFDKEAEKAKNGESILGKIVTVIGKILAGVGDLLSSATASISSEDISAFASGLWEAIKNGIEDVASKLTSGEIDLGESASKIGFAIGKAIRDAIQFAGEFLGSIGEWLFNEGGFETLMDIGDEIGSALGIGIVSALMGLLDPIGGTLFGDTAWQSMKDSVSGKTSKQMEATFKAREKEIAEYYQGEEARAKDYWEKHPEIQKEFEGDFFTYSAYFLDNQYRNANGHAKGDYSNFLAYMYAKDKIRRGEASEKDLVDLMYGFEYQDEEDLLGIKTPTRRTYGAGSEQYNAKVQAQMDQMAATQRQREAAGYDYDVLFDTRANQDAHQYGLDNYIAALETSAIEGIGNMTSEAIAALAQRISDLGLSPGFVSDYTNLDDLSRSLKVVEKEKAATTVETDNSQAQEAIEQTKESLEAIDGSTSTTTIVTKHVDTYETKGGDETTSGNDGGTGHGGKFGFGGRFNFPTDGQFGEDGTEYIIPITKPSRARGLILQMFREMGSRANNILADLGVPMDGGAGLSGPGQPYYRQPPGMYPSAGGSGSVKSNSDNTVTAPTTINVYGSGDPERTGRAAAQASERNIVRRVRGCFEG